LAPATVGGVTRRFVPVAILLVVLGGCGFGAKSSRPTTTPPIRASVPPPDACATLTRDEITRSIGATVGSPIPSPGTPPETCQWDVLKPVRSGDRVQVDVRPTREFDQTFKTRGDQPARRVYNLEAVGGIGDGAFFQLPTQAGPEAGAVLWVKQSGNAYIITVRNGAATQQQLRDQEKALGGYLAARV